jgi:hypothetical protein
LVVTLVLIIFFSKFLLHFACVENREKLWKKFFHIGSRWRQSWILKKLCQTNHF